MRKERRKKNREPFALLCKCNIASGGAEGLPGCRLWETEELKAAGGKAADVGSGRRVATSSRTELTGCRERIQRLQRIRHLAFTAVKSGKRGKASDGSEYDWIISNQPPTFVRMFFCIFYFIQIYWYLWGGTVVTLALASQGVTQPSHKWPRSAKNNLAACGNDPWDNELTFSWQKFLTIQTNSNIWWLFRLACGDRKHFLCY